MKRLVEKRENFVRLMLQIKSILSHRARRKEFTQKSLRNDMGESRAFFIKILGKRILYRAARRKLGKK